MAADDFEVDIYEAAKEALERNAMRDIEISQKFNGDTFYGIDILEKHNQITGWREKTRMTAAEKQQRNHSDWFWGIDYQEMIQLEEEQRKQESSNLEQEEHEQRSYGDEFWGLEKERARREKENERILGKQNLSWMEEQEREQCYYADSFFGIDAVAAQQALEHRNRLLSQCNKATVAEEAKKQKQEQEQEQEGEEEEEEETTAKGQRSTKRLKTEKDRMEHEESLQRAQGDTFWGLNREYIEAGLHIVQFRKHLLQKRIKESNNFKNHLTMSKHLAWSITAKKREEVESLKRKQEEERKRAEYMQSFYNVTPNPSSTSPSRLTFGSVVNPLVEQDPTWGGAAVGEGGSEVQDLSTSSLPSSSFLFAQSTISERRRRTDNLPSLENPLRTDGTFDDDQQELKQIRRKIFSSRHNVYQLKKMLKEESVKKRLRKKKFLSLSLPQVGLSTEARRRRRVVAGKVKRLSGVYNMEEDTHAKNLEKTLEQENWNNWNSLESYASLESFAVENQVENQTGGRTRRRRRTKEETPSESPSPPPRKQPSKVQMRRKKKKRRKRRKQGVEVPTKQRAARRSQEVDDVESMRHLFELDLEEVDIEEKDFFLQQNRYQEARRELRRDESEKMGPL